MPEGNTQEGSPEGLQTIREAKVFLRENYGKGTNCPCCNQFVKLYKRSFNTGMAVSLIYIRNITNQRKTVGWFNIQKEFAGRYKCNANQMDYIQLHRWGMIEPKPNSLDPTKKDSGLWRITAKGIKFVYGFHTVQQYASVYDNKTIEFTGKFINIEEALKNKFDYKELMGVEVSNQMEIQNNLHDAHSEFCKYSFI